MVDREMTMQGIKQRATLRGAVAARTAVPVALAALVASFGLSTTSVSATNSACPGADVSTPTSCTYTTKGEGDFTVPNNVTALQVVLVGATGGNTANNAAHGGGGATLTATIPASPGTNLFAEVNVGGGSGTGQGAGGGGESDLRTCSASDSTCPALGSSMDPRLLVGGGGGGAGPTGGGGGAGGAKGGAATVACAPNGGGNNGQGGGGGATLGSDGSAGQNCGSIGSAGQGGTGSPQCAGGGGGGGGASPAASGGGCTSGTAGVGGNAGGSGDSGGGGAGYYGGGGAGGVTSGGGGGGSSFAEPSASQIALADSNGAAPSVTISWSAPSSTVPESPNVELLLLPAAAAAGSAVMVSRRRFSRRSR